MVTNMGGLSHVYTVLQTFRPQRTRRACGHDACAEALEGAHVYMTIGHGGWPLPNNLKDQACNGCPDCHSLGPDEIGRWYMGGTAPAAEQPTARACCESGASQWLWERRVTPVEEDPDGRHGCSSLSPTDQGEPE
jgi:hypothetical protein